MAIALIATIAISHGTIVRAQEFPQPMMNFYGATVVVNTVFFGEYAFNIPGTMPYHKFEDWEPMSPGVSKGPPGFSLSDNASYNNAWQYWISTVLVNAALTAVNTGELADIQKNAGPLTGKSVTSFNFWQWVRMGQASLQVYGKLKGLYMALKSGELTIDIWKMLPKIAIDNENDPTAPMLMMSIVPTSQSIMGDIRKLTDFTDYRYRIGTFSDRLSKFTSNMGLSFGTRPGIYAITARLFGPDDPDNGWAQIYALQRSFHSTMTALDMIKRKSAGLGPASDDELKRRRGNSEFYEQGTKALADQYRNRAGGPYSDAAVDELRRGMRYLKGDTAELAQWAIQAAKVYKSTLDLENQAMNDRIQTAFSERYKAAAGGAALNNISIPLETESYIKSIKLVEDLIRKYAGQEFNSNTFPGDEQTIGLGIETADAWINRMIRDEVRAMRQIYGIGAKIEMEQGISPFIAQAGKELQKADSRLRDIEGQVNRMENGQWAYDMFYSGSDRKLYGTN
jgi:hypothetical protein